MEICILSDKLTRRCQYSPFRRLSHDSQLAVSGKTMAFCGSGPEVIRKGYLLQPPEVATQEAAAIFAASRFFLSNCLGSQNPRIFSRFF
jgi:hypothetical protein